MSNIKRENVVVQRFLWTDDSGHQCSAGGLLSAISILTESQKDKNFIDNQEVADVLRSSGLVEEIEKNKFKVSEEKREELVELGNKVSEAIGNELESIPVNTEIVLTPTIKICPVNK